MNLLPRTYWCHRDFDGLGRGHCEPQDLTTTLPGHAVLWMRESVRDALAGLDRPTFGMAWAWLGDHEASAMGVRALRRGRPYTFSLPVADGRWTWRVYPLSVLPVIDSCPRAPCPHHQFAVAHANGDPP